MNLPWVLGAAAIAAQILYPLTDGIPRDRLTIVTVALFFLACASHALIHRGRTWALRFFGIALGAGLLAEAIGVTTGFPFGAYEYAGRLGPKLLDVPLVIPLAWAMMAYPALLAGRRLTRRNGPFRVLVCAWALASWDLFLDPQMVDAGQWKWADPIPALPGVSGIPVTNFVGWLAVSLALMTVLNAACPDRPADDRLPATLYLWTYASSVLAAVAFFDRPGVALTGGVAMGLVAIPYAVTLRFGRR
jgi:putative membrane protein